MELSSRGWLTGLVAAGLLAFGLDGSAVAAGQFSWRSGGRIDSTGLRGLSCPSRSLCVGVDAAGDVLTTSEPEAGAGAWKTVHVDGTVGSYGAHGLTGVSCASVSLCVGVDNAGNVLVSTHPADGARAWTLTHVDEVTDSCPVEGGYEPCQAALTAISCPSVSLCVAVDSGGDVLVSTDPAGGGAWSTAHADTATYEDTAEHETVQASLTSISCPATKLCVAGDNDGNVITSTDPQSASAAWRTTHVDSALQGDGYGLNALSCPSASLCVAVDGYASDVITSTDPTGGPPAWTVTPVGDDTDALVELWCPFVSLCVAANEGTPSGNVASTAPTGGASAWSSTGRYGARELSALACASQALCLAVDADGFLLIGTQTSQAPTGTVTGTIQPGGGPPPPPRHRRKGLAGEVSVYSPSRRLIAREHVHAEHSFQFKLPPGRYLLNAGGQLYYPSVAKGCRPVSARIRARHTTTIDVYTGCGIK